MIDAGAKINTNIQPAVDDAPYDRHCITLKYFGRNFIILEWQCLSVFEEKEFAHHIGYSAHDGWTQHRGPPLQWGTAFGTNPHFSSCLSL